MPDEQTSPRPTFTAKVAIANLRGLLLLEDLIDLLREARS